MHRHCFRFPLGLFYVSGEIANNDYANFREVKEVYYGICASREWLIFFIATFFEKKPQPLTNKTFQSTCFTAHAPMFPFSYKFEIVIPHRLPRVTCNLHVNGKRKTDLNTILQQYKKVSIPVQRNPDFSNLQEI